MKLQLITYDDEENPEPSEKPNLRVVDPAPNTKKSPSIDAIIQRTHPSQRRTNSLVEIGIQDRFSALEQEELDLKEKERDLIRLSAEIVERERVVRETEILLDARDRLLDDREAVLSARHGNDAEDHSITVLEKSLEDMREALDMANDALAEKERFITGLRTEIEQLSVVPPVPEGKEAGPAPISFDTVAHPSLSDQVAFLREREAFIEESENTLFDKAQALQEWETRLQQNEHDQASSANNQAS